MAESVYEVLEKSNVNSKQITNNKYKLILKEEKEFCELSMKEHINKNNGILGRIWQDIECYHLKLNSDNEVYELVNKEEILTAIDNKIFDYLKEDKIKSSEIMGKINYVKSIVKSDEIISLFNNRGISAFIFMNRVLGNDSVSKSLGGIIDMLLIPFNFTFSKFEESEKYLKYTLNSEIDPAKSSIINIKALFREISKIPAEEKLDLELSIDGVYIVNKINNMIKDMKIVISFQMNEHNILTEYIMSGIDK